MLLFSSDTYPGLKLLCHTVVLLLIFGGISLLFSIMAAPVYIPTNRAPGSLFSTPICCLFIAILTGMGCHLTVVLICISLMVNDAEHIFMYLLASMSSSRKKSTQALNIQFLIASFKYMILFSKKFLFFH